LARTLGLPVFLLRALMPMSEYRAWRALALIEADVADLVSQGTDAATAQRMAWAPPAGDAEGDED
jgi:hypothetical protein